MDEMGDPLRARLFGYGVPYRVAVDEAGAVAPRTTDAAGEAERLWHALRQLSGYYEDETDGDWVYSLPFGRCGIQGRPREYIAAHFFDEAYLDVLSMDGAKTQPLVIGEIVSIEPGSVVRFRARPMQDIRVLVTFQTEDRTPLLGHAAPFTLDGEVPDDWRERLVKCHAAFDTAAAQASDGGHRPLLERFLGTMAEKLAGDPEIAAAQEQARREGSYVSTNHHALFGHQRTLLNEAVLDRIRDQDEAVFRFPGMFGAVAPLFSLID
ncbi:MAG: hypothetical protein F4Y91_04030 [Gemmatimonadetes bacterium]|nr:hypothetical protein [Gemmatimonadota bacterium]